MAGGVHGRGHAWQEGHACMARDVHGGGAWQGDMCGRGACVAGQKATAAGGTHPTGMFSCCLYILFYLSSSLCTCM